MRYLHRRAHKCRVPCDMWEQPAVTGRAMSIRIASVLRNARL